MARVQGHDILAIGASSGGVQAILDVVTALPADLPAAVFVVLHMAPGFESRLPEILTSRGRLPAALAMHGEPIVPGRVYVAPTDNHLTLKPGSVQVFRGPKESGHRPSVDALLRSAARAYGPRVIGVVLTGNLDCGTAGMLSVKARGGVAVVQDPAEAIAPSMPSSVVRHVDVDHVVSLREMPALLEALTREPAGMSPAELPGPIRQLEGAEPGVAAGLVCPRCQGTLEQTDVGDFAAFRCHVGHSFSFESAAVEQAEEVERALWAATRALDESVRMAQQFATRATGELRRRFVENAETQSHQAAVLRRILLGQYGRDAEQRIG